MENVIIKSRLELLRDRMKLAGMDWYVIPTADYHNSESVNDYFKVREFFTGFTGSNGTLLLSADLALLWTDGRYFIQAEKELAGTGIILQRLAEEGVPTLKEYLGEHLTAGQVLGFDGRVVDAFTGAEFAKLMEEKRGELRYEVDLAGSLWENRPGKPKNPIMILEERISGQSCLDKLAAVRARLKEEKVSMHVLGRLDDIMWLFNLRGGDIPCNPVAMSYAVVFAEEQEGNQAILFLQPEVITQELEQYAKENGFCFSGYGETEAYLRAYSGSVGLDYRNMNYLLVKILEEKCRLKNMDNPTELLKAVKNSTEQENMRRIYRLDSAVLTKFIYWIKKNIGSRRITEAEAAEYLDGLRAAQEDFLDLSFPTISAYGANAAMMHYQAEAEHCAQLKPEGMLLVDSGGQYMGGTTDVTRTIVLGPLEEQAGEHFTLTAMGMLQLLNARFLHGCCGRNLDILAREPLWEAGVDYKCGTGHGIGYMLNVHEGPADIRWRMRADAGETVLEEGMVLSNEPGVYLEGRYGIRTENIMLCRRGEKNGDGQFMYFEPLTFVPIDREGIRPELLSDRDRKRLNEYHCQVYSHIAPLLNGEEREWLKAATAPVT